MTKTIKIVLVVTAVLTVIAFVYRAEIKSKAKDALGDLKWFQDGLKWYRGTKNQEIVNGLHPKFRNKAKEFLSRIERTTDYYPILTSGYRSWAKQAALKKENSKNASPGNSTHNYGYAMDLNLVNKKTGAIALRKSSSKQAWLDSGVPQMAEEMKFGWGGNFKSYHDPIHYMDQEVFNLAKFKKDYLAGKKDSQGYVTTAFAGAEPGHNTFYAMAA